MFPMLCVYTMFSKPAFTNSKSSGGLMARLGGVCAGTLHRQEGKGSVCDYALSPANLRTKIK